MKQGESQIQKLKKKISKINNEFIEPCIRIKKTSTKTEGSVYFKT